MCQVLSTMSGIEVHNKCLLQLVFVFMYIFIQINTFKRLPVITLAFLPVVLTGFPAAQRESGGTGGCTKGIVCNSSLSYFFNHIYK